MQKYYHDIAVLGIYLIITLVMTWPLSAQTSTHLVGDDVDVLINPWADWWTRKSLDEGLRFYYTDYIFYPQGTSLVFHSFSHFNTMISLLLTPLVGYFSAYNLVIMLAYILSGFGMYLLVKFLTACRPAAFIAGVVFSFHPYHLFQSSHPVLVTTQFMPLFVLAFLKLLHLANVGQIKQVLLATLWFLLTALSSWHLMLMLSGWVALYLFYSLCFERTRWAPGAFRHLILLSVTIALVLSPFLWPILREHLTSDTTYVTVDVSEGRGNDLLSFFTPNRLHPIFGPLVLEINSRIGYTRNSPAYLGYIALGLGILGVITARRRVRFWWITGLVFLVLSLGAQVKWEGESLTTMHLPWAVPIIAILRHPLRINSLLFLSLATMTGFGSHWLYDQVASRSKVWAYITVAFLVIVCLFEYWSFPFPTTQPIQPAFLHLLADEKGDFAVADFPMDRQANKCYMFYQTIHDKKMVGGVVSRTPYGTEAFIAADPLLSAIQNENVPHTYLAERLAVLAAQDIRYIIIHKQFLDRERLENWQKWLAHFPSPYYEDGLTAVYRTTPPLKKELLQDPDVNRTDIHLGDHIRLRGYRLHLDFPSDANTLSVNLYWQSDSRLTGDYHIFVHLLDAGGQIVAQSDGVPVHGQRPTWSWRNGEVIEDEHTLVIDPEIRAGTYMLYAGMYDLPTGARLPVVDSTGERAPLQKIEIGSP